MLLASFNKMFPGMIFELFLIIFLALGVIFSLVFDSTFLQLFSVFLFSIISSMAYKRTGLDFPYFFLIFAFLLGFKLVSGVSLFWTIVIFIVGFILGKKLKKFLKKYFK